MDKFKVTDIMIDIETMALGPDAAIVQIGAVGFSVKHRYVDDELCNFSVDVDCETCFPYGGIVRQDAVEFWDNQGGFQHRSEPVSLLYALNALTQWIGFRPDIERVWSNHINFDMACLEFYYRRTGLIMPWTYRMPSDMPTVTTLARSKGWTPAWKNTVTHIGVQDASDQAHVLISACRHLEYLC